MRLIEIDWNPSERQLRQFGLLCLLVLPLIGWIWGVNQAWLTWLASAGAVLALVGLFAPQLLKPLFLGCSLLAMPIGLVIGEVAILSIYYAVFLPIGLVFRLCGRDTLQRSFDRQAASYWQSKERPKSAAQYYRQF